MQNQPIQQATTPKLPVPNGIQDAQIWGQNLFKTINTVASSDADEAELRASLFSLSRLAQSVIADLDSGVEELHSRASEQGSDSAGHQVESDQLQRQDDPPPAITKQQTARLTDSAAEAEAGIRELLAALDMAALGDVDSDTARDAVRGFVRLARSAHERAEVAARLAEELHQSNRPGHVD